MAKVLFLQDVWIEYYGVMQLSALLKRNGHSTDILFAGEEKFSIAPSILNNYNK